MIYIFIFLIGISIGSFLNVCIYRIPKGESVIHPPSRCPVCGSRIKWYDNIPLLSYFILRGKCRYCKSSISLVYPIVESISGLFSLLAYIKFGLSYEFVFYLLLIYMLIVGSFIDVKHYIIPDRISIGLVPFGILYGFLSHHLLSSIEGLILGFVVLYIVGAIGKIIFKKEAMGGGDIKLLAGIGSFIGIKGVLFTLFFSSVIGSVVGIVLILLGKSSLSSRLPFGPFLSAAAILYVFCGIDIVRLLGYA